jgi:predicted  nucleic acid-binding Zn-ribbon protein
MTPELKRLNDLLSLLEEPAVRKDDLARYLADFSTVVREIKVALEDQIASSEEKLAEDVRTVETNLRDSESRVRNVIDSVREQTSADLQTAIASISKELKSVRDLIPQVPDLSDELSALKADIMLAEDRIANIKVETAVEVRDKLETLKDEERLDASAIKGLESGGKKLGDDILKRAIGIVDQRTSFLINKVSNLQSTVNTLGTASGLSLSGDVIGSQSGSVIGTTIVPHAVSFAKFQEIGGLKLLGNVDVGSGEIEEITLGTNLSFDGSTLNASGGGGSGTSVTFFVDQTAHGFTVGNVLRLVAGSANTYAKALADSSANAEVVGIVSVVVNANRFELTTHGIVTVGVPAETAGSVLFLSDSVAGLLTTTEPTTSTSVSKPLCVVNESGVRMTLFNWRGMLLSGGSGGGGGGLPLTVTEIDAIPSVANVTTIRFSNSTVTDNGSGTVTVTSGGGGAGMAMEDATGTVGGGNVTFTTVNSPVWVTVNGQTLVSGDGFALSGTYTLTFDSAPTSRPHSFYNL